MTHSDKPKRTKPEGSGRKSKGGKMVSVRLSGDAIKILDAQPDKTAFIEAAIRQADK